MNYLKWSNIIFFQWLFIRLARNEEKRIVEFKLTHASLMPNGNIAEGGNAVIHVYQWYSILGFVLPLTGWKKDYIRLTKKLKYYALTKPKKQSS